MGWVKGLEGLIIHVSQTRIIVCIQCVYYCSFISYPYILLYHLHCSVILDINITSELFKCILCIFNVFLENRTLFCPEPPVFQA